MNGFSKILFDLDGTVLDRKGNLSGNVLKALQEAKEKISISFCTGKTPDYVVSLAQQIGLSTNHIVDDGSRVIDWTGKELWAVRLPQEMINYYIDLAIEYDFNISATVGGKQKLQITKEDQNISRLFPYYLNKKQVEVLQKQTFSDEFEVKVVWFDEEKGYNVSVTHVNGNKKHGIAFLFQYEGLEKKTVVGVGDAINDLPLFESVGYKVVMGNATDTIKAIADEVIPSVNEDGVAFLLKKLILCD